MRDQNREHEERVAGMLRGVTERPVEISERIDTNHQRPDPRDCPDKPPLGQPPAHLLESSPGWPGPGQVWPSPAAAAPTLRGTIDGGQLREAMVRSVALTREHMLPAVDIGEDGTQYSKDVEWLDAFRSAGFVLGQLIECFRVRNKGVKFNTAYIDIGEIEKLAPEHRQPQNLPSHRLIAQTWAVAVPFTREILEDFSPPTVVYDVITSLCVMLRDELCRLIPERTTIYWRKTPTLIWRWDHAMGAPVIQLRARLAHPEISLVGINDEDIVPIGVIDVNTLYGNRGHTFSVRTLRSVMIARDDHPF